jgi:alanine racemase
MTLSRRGFVAGVTAAAITHPVRLQGEAKAPRQVPRGFDPWIEVDPEALAHNVSVVSGLTGGRPILAVIKNNAYGLGLAETARVLEPMRSISGFAVVKASAAIALREAGIRKPVLLMGLFDDDTGAELVARDVHLALSTTDAGPRAGRAARRAGRSARGHIYLDTGMSRMGVPYHRALPWLEGLARTDLTVDGTFMGFTEEADFDREQLRRFQGVVERARAGGIALGALHAASSNGVFHLPEAHLDMVRPGIALFGAYPSDWQRERAMAELRPAVRLRARVVRVEQLRAGDGVSYGHNYVADRPTWVATLPVGHTDGVPREAVEGAKVLIGGRLYPIIGAVSASHSIVEVGDEERVRIGDEATLLGPDHPELAPNAVAAATGRSVYDVLMHLNPDLPRLVLGVD